MLSCLLLLASANLQQTPKDTQDPKEITEIVVPGFTAYGVPDHDRFQVNTTGVHNWTNPQETVEWHGLMSKGAVTATLNVRLPEGQQSQIRLSIGTELYGSKRPGQRFTPHSRLVTADSQMVTGKGDEIVSVPFSSLVIASAGYQTITVQPIMTSGAAYPDIVSLTLDGPAVVGSHFNLKERRNAASVHLHYPVDKDAEVSWFYNEVTPQTDPLYTYYEVCGFSRGYFGMQVNSRSERRIIFSVWDSGAGDDPALKSPNDKTRLIAKGDGVLASDFGNEGTGGHSHLVYPWVVNNTYRFLVGAKVDGDGTIYTGYFFDPDQKKWLLIASFRAPKDGKLLRGLYSFDENFGGSNGDLERRAEFGNEWIGSADGLWKRLTQARFTTDGTGKEDRLDYAAKADGDRFTLRTGGFLDEPKTAYGAILVRSAGGDQPKDLVLPPVPGAGSPSAD